jgi:DNA-binding GntR family transcriptional regulator
MDSISNLYLDAFQMEKITIEELTVVRCDIEKAMLDHVIDKAVESDFAALEVNLLEANRKVESNQPAIHENIEFHNLLAKASKNHVYSVVVGSITAATRDLLTRLINEPPLENGLSEYDENMVNTRVAVVSHGDILEAIRKRDKKGAARLLEQHLQEVGNRLKKLIR